MSDKIDWLKRLKLLLKALENNGVKTDVWVELETKISGYELDFSEHDKVFEDRIADLENIINHKLGNWDKHGITYQKIMDMKAENDLLKQRIAELESKETETCEEEPISDDCRPNIEWYENRHKSDCIEINRLNTTIDVLIHKVEYLRQFAGLE